MSIWLSMLLFWDRTVNTRIRQLSLIGCRKDGSRSASSIKSPQYSILHSFCLSVQNLRLKSQTHPSLSQIVPQYLLHHVFAHILLVPKHPKGLSATSNHQSADFCELNFCSFCDCSPIELVIFHAFFAIAKACKPFESTRMRHSSISKYSFHCLMGFISFYNFDRKHDISSLIYHQP